MNDQRPLLKAVGLSKVFESQSLLRAAEKVVALDGVDFELRRGEVVAIIGESGSGKTTLGKALCRLLSVDGGDVEFKGDSLQKMKKVELRNARRFFQMVFQNQSANLHPKMSVREMLDESLRLHRPELTETQRNEHAFDLAKRVGLEGRLQQRPGSLSGGEKRRAGLARILATKPDLIVADEPTSGLDAAIKLQIIQLLKDLKDDSLSYVIISHDLGLVRRIADRIVVMLHGRVIEEFPTERLTKDDGHHPYTTRLMRAAVLDRDRRRPPRERRNPPRIIRPNLADARAGCVYSTDCALAERAGLFDVCVSKRPQLVQIDEGRRVACHAIERHIKQNGDVSTVPWGDIDE